MSFEPRSGQFAESGAEQGGTCDRQFPRPFLVPPIPDEDADRANPMLGFFLAIPIGLSFWGLVAAAVWLFS
ncbi:MAG: hypothetical protein KDE55_21450 [Novosphingobium sp.]|nr:hypothetical protein [Novosphingobium sp.]